jgi:hypothetical protein
MPLRAGKIILADWRGDALPQEPNKRRPAGGQASINVTSWPAAAI